MNDSSRRFAVEVWRWLIAAHILVLITPAGAQTVPPEGGNVRVNETTTGLQAQSAAALLDSVTREGMAVWRQGEPHTDFVFGVEGGLTVCPDLDISDTSGCSLTNDSGSAPRRGLVLGDINGDQFPDAIFAVDGRNRFCPNDIGNFNACLDVSASFSRNSNAVALGHVDGVSYLDAIFANSDDNDGAFNTVCFGDSGGFSSCAEIGNHNRQSRGVALGDINGDGHLDAVFANEDEENSLCTGNGTGGFSCSNVNNSQRNSRDVALDDLDGDGDLDAVFVNQDQNNQVCLWDAGSFTCNNFETSDIDRDSRSVTLADLNFDGFPDAIVGNYNRKNRVCLNNGLGGFIDESTEPDTDLCVDVSDDEFRTRDVEILVSDTGSRIYFVHDGGIELCVANTGGAITSCDATNNYTNDDTDNTPPGFPTARTLGIVDLQGRPNSMRGRGVSSSDGPQGNEFRMDIGGAGESRPRSVPDVAGDLSGSGVAVWRQTNIGSVIEARRLSTTGVVGAPFLVAGGSDQIVEQPAVAMDASGGFVVVWHERTATSATVRARLYNAAGSALGDAFDISASSDAEARPDVAKDFASGNFLVVWRARATGSAGPSEIQGRLFDADGDPLTETFQVEENGAGEQANPAVAADLNGNYLVFWETEAFGGRDIAGRRFDSEGGAIDSEFQVNSTTTGAQSSPAAAVADIDGNFLVAWQSKSGSNAAKIYARWFASNFQDSGITQVPDFQVSTGSNDEPQTSPTAFGDLLGNFVVAWDGVRSSDSDGGVFAQRYAAPVTLQINDLSIIEGGSAEATATFTVQASKAPAADTEVTVNFQTLDGTASFSQDYVIDAGTLAFTSESGLTLPISVEVVEDTIFEEDENFFVQLDDAVNAVITRPLGVGQILNDDPPGTLTIDDVTEFEGEDPNPPNEFLFTVSLSAAQEVEARVAFETVEGTAVDDSDPDGQADYEATAGVLTIPPGFTEVLITVNVFDDPITESDEQFTVFLFEAEDATLARAEGIGTIRNDPTDSEACASPTIDPLTLSFQATGGAGSVLVTDSDNCGWLASTVEDWITIVSSPQCPLGTEPPCEHGGVGTGNLEYVVAENQDEASRSGDIDFEWLGDTTEGIDEMHVVTQLGSGCDLLTITFDPDPAEFLSAGGFGTVTVDATAAPNCTWVAISDLTAPWLSILDSSDCEPQEGIGCVGTGSGVIDYEVAQNDDVQRSAALTVAGESRVVFQSGRFLDEFDDDMLSPDWVYTGAAWTEGDSFLTTDVPTDSTATAIASPAFGGCVQCTISSVVRFDEFGFGTLAVYGWYQDDDNFVALTVSEFADTWTLSQRVAGVDAASLTYGDQGIEEGQTYAVEMSFDGTKIAVRLDGVEILTMVPGVEPDGTVGFAVDGTAASFDLIDVLTVTSGNPPTGLSVFIDGFESGETSSWSSVTPAVP